MSGLPNASAMSCLGQVADTVMISMYVIYPKAAVMPGKAIHSP